MSKLGTHLVTPFLNKTAFLGEKFIELYINRKKESRLSLWNAMQNTYLCCPLFS